MIRRPDRLLAISVHPGDVELAAGGTLAWLGAAGSDVAILQLRVEHPPRRGRGQRAPPELPVEGARAAAAAVGARHELCRTRWKGYLPPAEVRELLSRWERAFGPDLIVGPSTSADHPDHRVVRELLEQCFAGSVLGYETPWLGQRFVPQLYVPLRTAHLEDKLLAIGRHECLLGEPHVHPEYQRGHLRMRGMAAGVDHAEAFEVIRAVAGEP